ncbi:hypothetical protein LIS44_16870 (plasmid) [Acinetobacter haemolyticus]|nr:hypothetical protein LIS44_16870 [Acinetobacter haemolyticus]
MQSRNYEELNPYKNKVSNISNEIDELESQKNSLEQNVKQYQSLDIRDHANKIDKINGEIKAFIELNNSLRQTRYQQNLSLLVNPLSKYNPLNLFSKEKREQRKKYEETLKKNAFLEKEMDKVEAKLLKAYAKRLDLMEEVAFKEEFDLDEEIQKIEKIRKYVRKLIKERSALLNKFDSVEAGLKTIKDQLSIKNIRSLAKVIIENLSGLPVQRLS